jgi:hypothetical protein
MSQALESLVAKMTVAELAARAGITVSAFVELAFSGRASPKSTAAKPTKSTTLKPGKVPRGGLAADAVLAALRAVGESAKLEDVRAKTGGTVPQVRAALQKLAGSKKISITGQRRGTRYTAK